MKIPGYTATASGVTADDPNRTEGSWNQTVGSGKHHRRISCTTFTNISFSLGKEFIGGLVGAQGLKEEGARQNKEGQAQEAKGQVKDLGSGVSDRITGTVGGAFSSLTGDKAGQAHYQQMHDAGKTTQRGAEADIQKQAEAEDAARRQ